MLYYSPRASAIGILHRQRRRDFAIADTTTQARARSFRLSSSSQPPALNRTSRLPARTTTPSVLHTPIKPLLKSSMNPSRPTPFHPRLKTSPHIRRFNAANHLPRTNVTSSLDFDLVPCFTWVVSTSVQQALRSVVLRPFLTTRKLMRVACVCRSWIARRDSSRGHLWTSGQDPTLRMGDYPSRHRLRWSSAHRLWFVRFDLSLPPLPSH